MRLIGMVAVELANLESAMFGLSKPWRRQDRPTGNGGHHEQDAEICSGCNRREFQARDRRERDGNVKPR